MGQIAFQLQPGNISEVIENLDRSYSIIKVEKFIDPEYIPIKNVYNRIESILKRENQRLAKEIGLKNLHEKYNVIINEESFLINQVRSILLVKSCLFQFLFSQMPVDGIVAAVEDKIILKSDVVLNMQMAGINLSQNSIQLENIYNEFLRSDD